MPIIKKLHHRLEFVEGRKASGGGGVKLSIRDENVAEPHIELDEEWEVRAKTEYSEYLNMEKKWLTELGVLQEVI